jgi:hypothetical protein
MLFLYFFTVSAFSPFVTVFKLLEFKLCTGKAATIENDVLVTLLKDDAKLR